jgi:8-oxo-dGTP pyrophosphatase MutT (NUDIX family)
MKSISNRNKKSLKIIQAAGGVVYRRTRKKSKQCEILIIHRPKYDDWSLPKGKLLPGEAWPDAARREVREETGQTVRIQAFSGPVVYGIDEGLKLVLFLKMKVVRRQRFRKTAEVDKIKWVTVRRALDCLSYSREKDLIRKLELCS